MVPLPRERRSGLARMRDRAVARALQPAPAHRAVAAVEMLRHAGTPLTKLATLHDTLRPCLELQVRNCTCKIRIACPAPESKGVERPSSCAVRLSASWPRSRGGAVPRRSTSLRAAGRDGPHLPGGFRGRNGPTRAPGAATCLRAPGPPPRAAGPAIPPTPMGGPGIQRTWGVWPRVLCTARAIAAYPAGRTPPLAHFNAN